MEKSTIKERLQVIETQLSDDFKESNEAFDNLVAEVSDSDQWDVLYDFASDMINSDPNAKVYSYLYYHFC